MTFLNAGILGQLDAPYVRHWAEYHLRLGFSRILLYVQRWDFPKSPPKNRRWAKMKRRREEAPCSVAEAREILASLETELGSRFRVIDLAAAGIPLDWRSPDNHLYHKFHVLIHRMTLAHRARPKWSCQLDLDEYLDTKGVPLPHFLRYFGGGCGVLRLDWIMCPERKRDLSHLNTDRFAYTLGPGDVKEHDAKYIVRTSGLEDFDIHWAKHTEPVRTLDPLKEGAIRHYTVQQDFEKAPAYHPPDRKWHPLEPLT